VDLVTESFGADVSIMAASVSGSGTVTGASSLPRLLLTSSGFVNSQMTSEFTRLLGDAAASTNTAPKVVYIVDACVMEGANARAAIRDMTARLTRLGASEVVGLELAHTSEDGKLDLGRTLQGRSITSDDSRLAHSSQCRITFYRHRRAI